MSFQQDRLPIGVILKCFFAIFILSFLAFQGKIAKRLRRRKLSSTALFTRSMAAAAAISSGLTFAPYR